MTPEEIKRMIESDQATIKRAQDEIVMLQKICTHPTSTEMLYASEAMGYAHASPAMICDFCFGVTGWQEHKTYSVVVTNVFDKIDTIKKIRERTGMGFKETVDLINSKEKFTVKEGLNHESAAELQQELQKHCMVILEEDKW